MIVRVKFNHLALDRDNYNALELAIKAGHQSVVEVPNTKEHPQSTFILDISSEPLKGVA